MTYKIYLQEKIIYLSPYKYKQIKVLTINWDESTSLLENLISIDGYIYIYIFQDKIYIDIREQVNYIIEIDISSLGLKINIPYFCKFYIHSIIDLFDLFFIVLGKKYIIPCLYKAHVSLAMFHDEFIFYDIPAYKLRKLEFYEKKCLIKKEDINLRVNPLIRALYPFGYYVYKSLMAKRFLFYLLSQDLTDLKEIDDFLKLGNFLIFSFENLSLLDIEKIIKKFKLNMGIIDNFFEDDHSIFNYYKTAYSIILPKNFFKYYLFKKGEKNALNLLLHFDVRDLLLQNIYDDKYIMSHKHIKNYILKYLDSHINSLKIIYQARLKEFTTFKIYDRIKKILLKR